MEFKAYYHNIHMSAKKLRTILPEIKKMTPAQSLDHLYYSPKKGSQIFYKAIKSVIDNAKYTLKANPDMLKFKVLTVEQGQVLKRYQPGGRGTVKPYKRRFSHIRIVVESPEIVKSKQKPAPQKKEVKPLKVDSTEKKVKAPAGKKPAAQEKINGTKS